MSVRRLTAADLNRTVLARQLLLARATLSLPRALERIGGIQAQYAPTMYIGLWSRLEGFARDDLTRALERRTVVQGTLLRDTIHLVSAADYWPFALAVRTPRRQWWLRVARADETALVAAATRVRAALRAEGQLTRKQLVEVAGQAARGVGLWIDLVRVPPAGTWHRRRADLYASAEDWLGPPPELSPEAAVDHVVRRYLTAFGPATPNDVASWAGIKVTDVKGSLDRLGRREVTTADGQRLVDLARLPLPAGGNSAPVRFLSTWEAVLLSHARRAGVLRDDDRPRIFHTRKPQSENTFLVDGTVAGTWRYEAGHIELNCFRPLAPPEATDVHAEAGRLAEFHR